jgi:hypothetical protein
MEVDLVVDLIGAARAVVANPSYNTGSDDTISYKIKRI